MIRPLAYVAESQIERYARARQFPIIPCKLCGSQDNAQRKEVKRMLAEWERQYPGRTESIFSALRNVETAHLADPAVFDFPGLDAERHPANPSLSRTGSFPDRLLAGKIPGRQERPRKPSAAWRRCSKRASTPSST